MSGNTLTHRLFIDDGSDFIESSANNRTVNIIWIDHIRTILLHEIRDVHPSVNAYHLFTSNSYENNSNNITSRNELSMHQAYYLKLQNELSSSYQIPISGLPRAIMIDCPPDCQGGNNGCASQNRQLSCAGPTPPNPEDEPICSESASSSYAVSNSILTQVQADQLFNKPLHYDLRDDLLSTSNFGRKYINYYYSVSIYLSISDYSTYIYDIISLLDDINSACTKILNPATYGNDILITETFADELVELFNNLKSTTTNSDLTSIMNDIISDVEEIEGLTVNQVLIGYF